MKKHQAFSLVELSIVILIIGVLIAGVIQGSNLVTKFRIRTAQTLTQSSPVNSIKDLVFWHETVADASLIDSEESNNTGITTWYDINPQKISKNNSTGSGGGAKYIEAAKNGLPVLRFDGVDDMYTNSTVQLGTEMSTFAVIKTTSAVSKRLIHLENYFYVGNYSGNELTTLYGNGSAWNHVTTFGSDAALTFNQYQVISSVLKGTDNRGYVNGTDVGNPTGLASESKVPSVGLYIGAQNYWLGDIGELIVFNRGLTAVERKAVEKYLGQKWGIFVSS